MNGESSYHFSDDAKLAILQARHEALHQGAPLVAPEHLALGVLHTLSSPVLQLLFPDPANLALLCRALGGSDSPAPVIPRDIGYQEEAREALDGATRLAHATPDGPEAGPLHILLGILRPWLVSRREAAAPGPAALALAATGLAEGRLRTLLPRLNR